MNISLVNDWSSVYPTWEQQQNEENARQYARIFFEEMERLKAEKIKKEEEENRKNQEFCDYMRQFQPKMPEYDVDKALIDLALKEQENNPNRLLCQIADREQPKSNAISLNHRRCEYECD